MFICLTGLSGSYSSLGNVFDMSFFCVNLCTEIVVPFAFGIQIK